MTCQVLTVDIEYFQGTLNSIAHYNTGQLATSKTVLRLYQRTFPIGAIPSAYDFFLTQLTLSDFLPKCTKQMVLCRKYCVQGFQ